MGDMGTSSDSLTYYCIYVSSAVNLFTKSNLVDLLTHCREANRRIDVTGMLLYQDGNFMQALEGPEDKVKALLEKILKDPRHRGILLLIEGTTRNRRFPDWSMGFRDLNSAEVKNIPGFSDFLNTPLGSQHYRIQPSDCEKLLDFFKQSQR
jgi:hypothetical protein